MNGLKKLFSPSTLAATLASGMLLSSAIIALADDISTSTVTSPPTCDFGHQPNCWSIDQCGVQVWWCCTSSYPTCDGVAVGGPCTNHVTYGFCKSR